MISDLRYNSDNSASKQAAIDQVRIENENYFRIANYDAMRPFFMSIVSDSNHWMFISSNGGLSAGRINADHALFPYYTDDKIAESVEVTGSKSIFIVNKNEDRVLWEPFSERFEGKYAVSRNLYKNTYGNKILFEEINHDLQLTYRYEWNSSDVYGFVKKSKLINDSEGTVEISLLDGIQNILPYGVGSDLQNKTSNLVDAYKRSELIKQAGLGIYALSAIISDKAEPSEALKANVAWSVGFEKPKYLLSSLQLKNFRRDLHLHEEVDIKAEKGAYFINTSLTLSPHAEKSWMIMADINKDHADVAKLIQFIKSNGQIEKELNKDIEFGTERLIKLNASADGLQMTADVYRDTRHFANSLFNIMRGGVFDLNYQIEKRDFSQYISKANQKVFQSNASVINDLPEVFTLFDLKDIALHNQDRDFTRLCIEYLPLKFSRRHGDPSRPWNHFSINTRNENDGSKILDYQGNWRDIFQNWEALAHSFPGFIEGMIFKFLNATTFEGYNPYRVTKDGFDWETIEPDNPWSYIGYWGDHQIIYLLKFLEFIEMQAPGKLASYFNKDLFVYANVPYRIKSYSDILKNSKDTIEFDFQLDSIIHSRKAELGADGALLLDQNDSIHRVTFLEKILATVLAKMSNFIPEGGIWMNTQRPEWNDANNALVGNGISMVTLYYLRRFLKYFENLLTQSDIKEIELSEELQQYFGHIHNILASHKGILSAELTDLDRKLILDKIGQASSNYRELIYNNAFTGEKKHVSIKDLKNFVDNSLEYLEHSIQANIRHDHLYHAYNLMTLTSEKDVSISYLSEMLEGQVAVLSSGFLSAKEALGVLDGLKNSKLFREDQYSYLLYPNKRLSGFIEKNIIPEEDVKKSELLKRLLSHNDTQIIEKDVNGDYHFNGNFKNAKDLKDTFGGLDYNVYGSLIESGQDEILLIFEKVFNHKSFTGRSGTFYGYEGLGSIYWHMVSKLQLAVQECCLKAINEKESDEIIGRLLEHYYEINEGIGIHKPPSLYGAFPTDPYSHTPAGKGAQQPGMTGQVKEDILSRFGELGVFVNDGKLFFNPCLLRKSEFLSQKQVFEYVDVFQEIRQISLDAGSLCFTYCQIPIIYSIAGFSKLEVISDDAVVFTSESLMLDLNLSKQIFQRTGIVDKIIVHLEADSLR